MAKKKQAAVADPYMLQAMQYAAQKYGPEISGLKQLAAQAKADYASTRQQAAGANDAIQKGVVAAAPVVNANFAQAADNIAGSTGIVDQDLAKIGPVGGQSAALQQAIQLERGRSASSNATLKQGTLDDLTQRGLDATTALGAANKAALNAKSLALGQVAQRAQDLAGEQGSYISSTAQDLAGGAASAQAKAEQQAADRASRAAIAQLGAQTQLSAAQLSADTSTSNAQLAADTSTSNAQLAAETSRKNAAAAAKGKRPDGLRSASQHSSFQDEVAKAQRAAKLLGAGKGNTDRASLETSLVDGYSSYSKQVPVTNKDGKKVYDKNGVLKTRTVRQPGLKPVAKDPLAAAVALDLAQTGKVQRDTLNKLHKAGYSIKELGVPYQSASEGAAKNAVAGAVSGAPAAAGGLLDELIRALGG